MNSIYRIKLTPLEPYFFGGEKIFYYGDEDKRSVIKRSYYIRSENTPSQTTLFGVLRYLGIRRKRSDYKIDGDDIANIGKESFKYDKADQEFGRIVKISPLYIMDENQALFARTPMDYKVNIKGNKNYKPFKLSDKMIKTSCGKRIFPLDGEYDAKCGIADSYMNTSNGNIEDELFESVEKVGINIDRKREKNKDSFFKMEYKRLKQGYSFAFFAELKDNFFESDSMHDRIVYMGSKKSTFAVEISKEEAFPQWSISADNLNDDFKKIYLESDCMIDEAGMQVIQEKMLFGVNGYITAREFTTNYESTDQRKRFHKTENLYRLLKAGSIFVIREEDVESVKEVFTNMHYETVGYNNIKIGG